MPSAKGITPVRWLSAMTLHHENLDGASKSNLLMGRLDHTRAFLSSGSGVAARQRLTPHAPRCLGIAVLDSQI